MFRFHYWLVLMMGVVLTVFAGIVVAVAAVVVQVAIGKAGR